MKNQLWIVGRNGMLARSVIATCEKKGVPFFSTSSCDLDITSKDKVEAFAPPPFTHIVNCAAYTDVDGAERDEKAAYALNRDGPRYLAEKAISCGAKLIHISTDYVFDGELERPYEESDATSPLSVYGKSKRAGEEGVLTCSDEHLIVRTSWLFGTGKNFVATMKRLMGEREALSVVCDQYGRPTFADDLARALFEMAECRGLYHFANAGTTNWYEFAQAIKKRLCATRCTSIHPISTEGYPTPAKRPPRSILSTAKVEKILRRKPRHFEECLDEYLK